MLPTSSHATLEYLYGLQKFGIKLGLHNIRSILRSLGHPEKRFPSVHVAGTNGKGSTSSMIASVLTAAGYHVGLYTSPHLVHFHERIRVNGKMISDADLVRYTEKVRPAVEKKRATFFEATTAIAFQYFADHGVDVAVIETGLGGRFDATNTLTPLVSVITSIGKDHTQQLGKTIASISAEKGGIIKRGVPCVYGGGNAVATKVLRTIAVKKQSPFLVCNDHTKILNATGGIEGERLTLLTKRALYEDVHLSLPGTYQRENYAAAILALEILGTKGFDVSATALRRGMGNIVHFTGLRGRCECLRRDPMVLLDVAHNPDALTRLVALLAAFPCKRLKVVFGVMKDKDYRSMAKLLAPLNPVVYAAAPAIGRALPADLLKKVLVLQGVRASAHKSVEAALKSALRDQKKGELLIIIGSHYVAGEALEAWVKLTKRTHR
jgi:dihydrofolate synthase/folylpolyglutamate synthase